MFRLKKNIKLSTIVDLCEQYKDIGKRYTFPDEWQDIGNLLQDLIEKSGKLITSDGNCEKVGMQFVDCIRSTVTKICRSPAGKFSRNAYDIREVLKWIEKYGGTIDYDMDGAL